LYLAKKDLAEKKRNAGIERLRKRAEEEELLQNEGKCRKNEE
jgi:hypothetical protein